MAVRILKKNNSCCHKAQERQSKSYLLPSSSSCVFLKSQSDDRVELIICLPCWFSRQGLGRSVGILGNEQEQRPLMKKTRIMNTSTAAVLKIK